MFLYLENTEFPIGGDSMVLTPEKRLKIRNQIRSNILEKTNIKNRELAEEIARKWVSFE